LHRRQRDRRDDRDQDDERQIAEAGEREPPFQ
jgi:hypothetical protein